MNKINKKLSMLLLTLTLQSCEISDFLNIFNKESSTENEFESELEDISESNVSVEESSKESSKESISEKESESVSEKASESTSVEEEIVINDNFKFNVSKMATNPTVEEFPTSMNSYSPTTFNASSYTETRETLSDGVILVKGQFTLNNGRTIKPRMIEVDLTKANIVAGTTNNTTSSENYKTKSTPVAQANAWETANPDKKALAVTNADFFGSRCVNAFVKDGVILESRHIDDSNDLPVSSPMLFGVSSAGARIGAMTTTGSRTKDYQSSLEYGVSISMFKEDGTFIETLDNGLKDASNSYDTFSLYTKSSVGQLIAKKGIVYKIKRIQMGENNIRACIVKKIIVSGNAARFQLYNPNEKAGDGYLFVGKNVECQEYEVGTYLYEQSYVKSPNNTWDYYDTILGCRHSLIENGVLPATLSSETSNGTSGYCPRTAVGIKLDRKVIILSVEDMHYGGKADVCSGLTATQMADFLRYYGVYDAANFDGGGSSQLCTKTATTSWKVQVRSSDYGLEAALTPGNSRNVINSIIVTTK